MTRILSLALLAATLCVNACGSEAPVKIPAPAFDPPAVAGKLQTAVRRGRLLLGRAGRLSTSERREERAVRLCRWRRVERGL